MENITNTEQTFDSKKDYNKFVDFLTLKEVSDSTIHQYITFYKIFPKEDFDQISINKFLLEHRGSVSRAFLRNYLEFREIHNIKIPVRSGRKKRRIPETITEEESQKIRKALYSINEKYGLMFDITIDGALRRTEIVSLTPSALDWNTWGKDMSKPCRCRIVGKGNKERIVIISPETTARLRDYLKPLLKQNIVQMTNPMFKMGVRRWWEILKITSETILGKRVKPHSLRRTTATEMYESGKFDILDISRFLGHSNISTTQIYLNPDTEKSIKKFEDFYIRK